MAVFKHYDLQLINPAFDSQLVDVLTELEHLRRLELRGTTPAPLFFQLKEIFHVLESLGSARIEGNHTTLADYVEGRLEGRSRQEDHFREMENIERAMAYVEESILPGAAITQHSIREIHALAVSNLLREGDDTPGQYRNKAVAIAQSNHLPPDAVQVAGYMDDLEQFINKDDASKYDLIKVALAHHRFGWIHPFGNGNGRVVRLLTYAMLIKYGFNVTAGRRLLNPTAVFCNDRERYYAMLSEADTGEDIGLENWCLYVLRGILEELRKVDQLTNFQFLCERILVPALDYSQERQLITPREYKVLQTAISTNSGVVKSADLAAAMPKLTESQRTYQIRKLVSANMLQPIEKNSRQYTLGFSNNYLIRGVIKALTDEGFVPMTLHSP